MSIYPSQAATLASGLQAVVADTEGGAVIHELDTDCAHGRQVPGPFDDPPKSPNCRFCGIIASDDSTSVPEADRAILETDTYWMMAALGPLVLGHALLVTKHHGRGLLHEPTPTRAAYRRLAQRLRGLPALGRRGLLEVEHGGATTGRPGPCISHTHIHLLPGLGHLGGIFDAHLPRSDIVSESSYIWTSDGTSSRLYNAERLPGQGMRRIFAQSLEVEDWDWLLCPNIPLVRRSRSFWEEALDV